MTMPFGYVSPEQLMKDRADYARKGIARGRSVVVLAYDGGILFVAENLSRALGGARIIDYPWYPSAPIDVAVAVNVLAFEVDPTGAATLNAGWTLRDPHSRQGGYEGRSSIVEPAGGPPGEAAGDAAVAALSRALAQLSREVAVGIVTNTRSR